MTDAQFAALRATMPWSERVVKTNVGALVQVVNAQGYEVPMFDMTRFLTMITLKIANGSLQEKDAVKAP